MNAELPPSLDRFRAELTTAITRELQPPQRPRVQTPRYRLFGVSVGLMAAVALAAGILMVVGDNGGIGVLTPAYAAFTTNGVGPFSETAWRVSGGPPETITNKLWITWTNTQCTITDSTTTRDKHRVKVQQSTWRGQPRGPLPRPSFYNVVNKGKPGQFAVTAFETIDARRWQIAGGSTNERNGRTVSIYLFRRFYVPPHFGPAPLKFVQIRAGGQALTFQITSHSSRYKITKR